MNQSLFSYITIAFIAPVVFLCCINDRDRHSYGLIFFHGRSIFWKTLLFSLPSLLDFLMFVPILSTGDCNVDISEQVITRFILKHEKLLQFDWLRAVVFQLNLKYLHVKSTNLFILLPGSSINK